MNASINSTKIYSWQGNLTVHDTMATLAKIFGNVDVMQMLECTDCAELKKGTIPSTFPENLIRLRIYDAFSEVIVEKDGDGCAARLLSDRPTIGFCENGADAFYRDTDYQVRKTLHNSSGASELRYREYFSPNEDGMPINVGGRLVAQ